MFKKLLFALVCCVALSCQKDPIIEYVTPEISYQRDTTIITGGSQYLEGENLIICSEGSWGSNNGQLANYDLKTGVVQNNWFASVNTFNLGDTPNQIIQVNDTLCAITVNWSNVIQFIRPNGTACGYTEVPNNRMCAGNDKYLFVTSFATEVDDFKFEKGFVAKIDLDTKKVVAACETDWEPEGIAYYNGKLFVCNTGSYHFDQSVTTITVVDAETMTVTNVIDTGVPNLYSNVSVAGKYMICNSAGNYMDIGPSAVIVNMETEESWQPEFNGQVIPANLNATYDGKFYCVGTILDMTTYMNTVCAYTVDPETKEVTEGIISKELTDLILGLYNPYGFYISPYSGEVFVSAATDYVSPGDIYHFTKDGTQIIQFKAYVCPSSMVAIPRFETTVEESTIITVTPIITYPQTKSANRLPNDWQRQKFLEAWNSARR